MLLAFGLAVCSGGCGVSFPMTSLVSDDLVTGSIRRADPSPLSPVLTEEDWRRARGALGVALDPVGNGSRAVWDNPETKLQGSFTPVGQAFVKSDEVCRAFVAELKGPTVDETLQGTGCRASGAEWTVRDVKPWKAPA